MPFLSFKDGWNVLGLVVRRNRLSLVCSEMFFFVKQKTAYDIMPSLVGSEMCIRDRSMSRKTLWMICSPSLSSSTSALPMIQQGEPVSYTHLTLPTIYSV